MGLFSKKKDDGDGSKKGSSNSSDNPYAKQGNDPYASGPPLLASQAAYKQYKSQPYGASGLPGVPSPALNRTASNTSQQTAPPPYNSSQGSGYGNDRYGAPSGYGSNRYDSSAGSGARPGGYGGLGSDGVDQNRDALFSGVQERQSRPGGYDAPITSGASGAGSNYGGYGERRELTEEEQEEAEVGDIRRQIKETKLSSAQSAENSERIAAQAVETAMGTYARLGSQGERLVYTEGLLDKAGVSTREAEGQTRKLKSLNRSMFAVHVDNPFTSKRRTAEMEQKIKEEHEADRTTREQNRKDGYVTNARLEAGFKEIEASRGASKWQPASAAEKQKFKFEDDSEDDDAEDRINASMARTANHVAALNNVAKMMGKEIESQDQVIGRLGEKSDVLDTQAKLNTERLRRIR